MSALISTHKPSYLMVDPWRTLTNSSSSARSSSHTAKASRINLARSAFSRLQSCLWSRREISLRTKGRVYQAVVCSILLYGCEIWCVRVADEGILKIFDNDSTRRILRIRRRDCVSSVELRRHLCLASIPPLLVQRRLCWFRHATRRPDSDLIKDLLLPTSPRTWRKRTRGHLKTWTTTIKATHE